LTLTLELVTLKLMRNIARGMGNPNFGVSGTFHFRLMGHHLSDAPCEIATLTFDLGGHGTCRRYGSPFSICVPSLKSYRPFRSEDMTHFCSQH